MHTFWLLSTVFPKKFGLNLSNVNQKKKLATLWTKFLIACLRSLQCVLPMTEEVIFLCTSIKKFQEFLNSNVREIMRKYSIAHFQKPTNTPWKASIVERVNRTIKTRLWRYFQHTKSTNWVSVLQQFVENYNATPHSSIGMAPNDVTEKNRKQVLDRLFPKRAIKIECSKNVGDQVRILRKKTEHEKGYTPKWSEEVYIITKELQSNGVCWYKLSDQTGKVLPGVYYSNQLNLVSSFITKK